MHTVRCLLLAVAASFVVAAPAGARGLDVDVIADELDNPRHVAVAKNGDVYVAEAGEGGNHATARSCFDTRRGLRVHGPDGRHHAYQPPPAGAGGGRPRLIRPGKRRQRDRPARRVRRRQRRVLHQRRPDRADPRRPAADRAARPDAGVRGADLGPLRPRVQAAPVRRHPAGRGCVGVREQVQPGRRGRQRPGRQQPGRRARGPRAVRDRRRGRQQHPADQPQGPPRGAEPVPEHADCEAAVRPRRSRCRRSRPAWSRARTASTT